MKIKALRGDQLAPPQKKYACELSQEIENDIFFKTIYRKSSVKTPQLSLSL